MNHYKRWHYEVEPGKAPCQMTGKKPRFSPFATLGTFGSINCIGCLQWLANFELQRRKIAAQEQTNREQMTARLIRTPKSKPVRAVTIPSTVYGWARVASTKFSHYWSGNSPTKRSLCGRFHNVRNGELGERPEAGVEVCSKCRNASPDKYEPLGLCGAVTSGKPCAMRQYRTPSGPCCMRGHGGADALEGATDAEPGREYDPILLPEDWPEPPGND